MKKKLFGFLSALLIASATFVACDGGSTNEPEGGELQLRADKLMLDLDNEADKVTFTVTRDGVDLTKTAEIWQIEGGTSGEVKLTSNTFSTKEAGNYKFEARYADGNNTVKSAAVTVGAGTFKEVYFRKIFVQKFTATSCTYCPSLTKTLDAIATTDDWESRMVRTEFHTNFTTADPMHHNSTNVYKNKFGLAGLPGLLPDFMDAYKNDGTASKSKLIEYFNEILEKYPAMCGVAIDSKYDAATRKVTFTTKVKASWANEFAILPFLLEDKIIAPQLTTGEAEPKYEHNHVLRATFTDALLGERLGMIAVDEEVTKTYEYVLPAGWVPENMSVVACVLAKSGDTFLGNNSTTCPLDGSVDYIYNK